MAQERCFEAVHPKEPEIPATAQPKTQSQYILGPLASKSLPGNHIIHRCRIALLASTEEV
jgi:hypothetical protein